MSTLLKKKKGFFMPSKRPIIAIRTNNETIEKFNIIAEEERRSMSNLGEKIILDYIKAYEKEHGKINIKNINVIENKGTINM